MPAIPAVFAFLAANAGAIGTAAVIGGGAAMAANAANEATQQKNAASDIAGAQRRDIEEQKKAIEAQTLAAKEAPGKAQDAAKVALEKRRRIQMLSGGQTLLAGETVSNKEGKTLLGG